MSWANAKALMKLSHYLTNGSFFSLSPHASMHISQALTARVLQTNLYPGLLVI